MPKGYDVIIIGTGPAGISASIYTSRAKLKTLVIGKPKQGALYKAHSVSNYMGFAKPITGKKLIDDSIKQSKKFKTTFYEGEVINAKKGKTFTIKVEDGKTFSAKAIILATGKSYKLAGAQNEEKFSGKGVHYCVTCDGYFYNKKKIAVVGHSNLAAEEALSLLTYTKDITIYSNGLKFDFSPFLQKAIKKNKITLKQDKVKTILGKKVVDAIQLESGEKVPYNGVFMALGRVSALNFASRLGITTKNNEVVINREGETDVEGVYAAGNCTGGNAQAANSVGEGCNAALSIIKKIKGGGPYLDYD